ncbi:AAA family ATPase [Pseudacidovorax intermedius]|uniref:AAA family ATPase n=1 Tax=Pseudacidovorax intermedius TaxID=433924 RepID=UPI0026EB68FA|nr:AAA family ATPase [Pseudacidovorax intermedius]
MNAVLQDIDAARPAPPDVNNAVSLICGSLLRPQPIEWLWRHWLAAGKFHLLAGIPGQGKTTLAMTMAAVVSIGGVWPDGSRCNKGSVVVFSGEDDAADTLLPRIVAAAGDPSRVFFVQGTRIDGELVPFDPARDLLQLTRAIEQIGDVRLVVVDPVVSAVNGDSHKNTEVRRALQPLVDLAASCGCAIVGITHFAKGGQGQDPAQRVVGSVAFSAVARVVIVAAKVRGEEGQDSRILARAKSNIGPDDGGFEYHLDQVQVMDGIEASRIGWGQAVQGTARDLLTSPDEDPDEDASDAVSMLRVELVNDSWTEAEKASSPLRAAGFTKKQIWAASKKLGVIRQKGGMHGGWYWRLPGGTAGPLEGSKDSEGFEDSSSTKAEPSGSGQEDSQDSVSGILEPSESSESSEEVRL